jgi:hypothetical protein
VEPITSNVALTVGRKTMISALTMDFVTLSYQEPYTEERVRMKIGMPDPVVPSNVSRVSRANNWFVMSDLEM